MLNPFRLNLEAFSPPTPSEMEQFAWREWAGLPSKGLEVRGIKGTL